MEKKHIYSYDEIVKISMPIWKANEFVKKAYLFGSYARGEANSESDLDFYVTIDQNVGLEFYGLSYYLENKFSLPIDVLTENEVNNMPGQLIGKERKLIYERTN